MGYVVYKQVINTLISLLLLCLCNIATAAVISGSTDNNIASPPRVQTTKAEPKLPSKEQLSRLMDDDHAIGNRNAKVILIEYSSLACPHCAEFHKNVFPKLKQDYFDNDKVLYIHRQFPTNQPSVAAAALCICSGAKYFQFIDALLISQNSWAFTENYKSMLLNIAKLSGMDNNEFNKCVDNKVILDRIYQSNLWASNVLEVDATPTFFLNGEKISGATTYTSFSNRINKALIGAVK